MKEIFHADVDLYLLKTCAKILGKVIRNKRIKPWESRTRKVNLCINILSLKFCHLYLKFRGMLSLTAQIMGYIKQKECYRSSFKPWNDLSNWINKKENWLARPEDLEILALKVCSLLINRVIYKKPQKKGKYRYICLRNKNAHN